MLHHRMRRAVAGSGGGGDGGIISDGALVDFDCDSFSDPYTWTESSNANGSVDLETFDGRDTFSLSIIDGPVGVAYTFSNPTAAIPDIFTVSIVQYIDSVIAANTKGCRFRMTGPQDDGKTYSLDVQFRHSDGKVYINNEIIGPVGPAHDTGATYNLDAWETWTFECDFTDAPNATCRISRGNSIIVPSIDCSAFRAALQDPGKLELWNDGTPAVGTSEYYVDRILVGNGLA